MENENQNYPEPEIRLNIVLLNKQGYSQRNIAMRLNISRRKVRYWIENWSNEKRLHNKKKKKKSFSIQLSEFVKNATQNNRSLSSKQLSKIAQERFPNEHCSESTIYRIRKSLKFDYKPPRIRQFLTELQKAKRILFALDMESTKTNWNRVIFSDESWFYINSQTRKIWRMPNEKSESVFQEKKHYDEKVLIWGAFGVDFKSRLIVINGSINTHIYIKEILKKSKIIKKANEKFGEFCWIFQQDGARPHTSTITMSYLRYRCNVLHPWPPNSPDLNPIENLLAIMDKRFSIDRPKNKKEFTKKLKKIWKEVTDELMEKLVSNMTKRLDLVIQREGESINGFY
ncbi:transposable element-related [Anaeramoeba flamelloides]|uniref:Transposable element-related n=1 Tax=Anaeramoeba flamelloides TaxID=1746091 RepID=A0AAV7Y7V3_9EUKA|nr:transposable element-related [Anaeramoeba flamelloides]